MKRTPLRRRTALSSGPRSNLELRGTRQTVRRRCDERCEANTPVCVGQGDQLHHRLRRSQGGMDTPEHTMWVCSPCHVRIHHYPAEAFEHGWLVHRGEL